jgi:hypothetical protein
LQSPSEDAEGIAQLLSEHGDFRVKRLPAVKKEGSIRVGQKTKVTFTQLEKALVELFMQRETKYQTRRCCFFLDMDCEKTWAFRKDIWQLVM